MVASISLVIVAPVSAESSGTQVTSLTITGHGFGHGIGLSQWGAEERATAGQTHEQILAFYYPGTAISSAARRAVRVLLDEQPRLVVGSAAAFTARDADGDLVSLPAGHFPVTLDGRLNGRSLTLPLNLRPSTMPLMLGGSRYRGTLTIARDGDRLAAVNTLDLEQYVADVVSYENPAYWPQEALRSQAIASRTYALANLRPDAGWDLYPDDRSQNYGGLRKEYPSAIEAATATRGQVLRYQGELINALFSASNGGLTSGNDGVWGGSQLPYFTVRADHFDTLSPASTWGPVRIGISTLRQDFPGLPATVSQVVVATNTADRATSLTFTGADGSSVTINGSAFQQRLGLRSTYLSLVASY